jgi:hypothetical protein
MQKPIDWQVEKDHLSVKFVETVRQEFTGITIIIPESLGVGCASIATLFSVIAETLSLNFDC